MAPTESEQIMNKRLTKSEQIVLQAMRLRDEVAAQDIQADIEAGRIDASDLRHTDRVRQDIQAIVRSCRIVAITWKPGEASVHNALRKLVARGLVEKDTLTGMGGGFTTFKRTEA